ncbi:MAG: LD-carboxypeptidase [Burkholderiaceae bacterium]
MSEHNPRAKSRAADIHVISPAGVVLDAERLHRARANLAARGYRVALDRGVLARDRRFAGSDRSRLAAFRRAARSAARIVMISRGGYGITRLLAELDFAELAASGKHWVGFSDFTAFQLAMLAREKAPTWSGPSLIEDYGGKPDPTTADVFDDAMAGRLQVLGFASRGPSGIDESGILWGGNLAMVCSLLATPYMPAVRGGILMLEDVGEHPYRIERMLSQLLQAGVIDAQAALLLGSFNGFRPAVHDGGYGLADVIRWLRRQTKTPVIEGLPFGHGVAKLTLPHGSEVGLASSRGQTYLVMPHAH